MMGGCSATQIKLTQYSLTNPANHRDGFAVSDRFVAGALRTVAGRLAAPRDPRVVVGEALAALPLDHTGSADAFGLQYICLSVIERASPFRRECRMK